MNSPTFSGTVTIPTLNVTGTLALQQTFERTTISTSGATGTINYYLLNQAILYYTGTATGDWTLNITGNSGTTLNSVMSIGQTVTCVFIVTNGATGYYQTGLQIDGTAVTPKWYNGSSPTSGDANATDIYSFTIVKTANATYAVFETLTLFK
jgi:hypothetical protein